MNFLAVPPLISSVLFISLGLFVFLKNPHSRSNQAFGLMCLVTFWWQFSWFILFTSNTEKLAKIMVHVGYTSIIFIPYTFYHFFVTFLKRDKEKSLVLYAYLLGFIFLFFNWTSDLYIKGYYRYPWGYYPRAGFLHPIYLLSLFSIAIRIVYLLYKGLSESKSSPFKYNQIKYILFAFISYTLASSDFAVNYGLDFYPLGFIFIMLSLGIMAYTILKYHLLDINIALSYAGIFVVVYTLVLGFPFLVAGWGKTLLVNLLGNNWFWFPLALFFVLATFGPFIYLYFQRRAEKLLRKEQLAYQEELRKVSSTMMLNKDLDKLLRAIVLNVVDIVKVEWAAVYLKDQKQSKYIQKHYRSKVKELHLPKEFSFDSELIRRLHASRLPLIGEELRLEELKVGLVVPCFVDSNMLGFLLLGDKAKGKIYDQTDVNAFTLLSNQTALAIENCQYYSEERQRQHYLRLSSLDRQMASMAHEIDNPIAATVSGLGSLELALDDYKEVIPADRMEYLKAKIKRAKFNSLRVSKMINAVRQFSKPSSGEFKPVKLNWILEDFQQIIEPQFHHYGIDFKEEAPQEEIWLRVDKIALEEVLVNLGNNAVQAINEISEGRHRIPGMKKEVSLKAYNIEPQSLRIDFRDTGSGIKDELLEQIFLDFVTTKASSEGTGLGLSIARKIIAGHNGRIWAESKGEGKGATFHIELPIPNDITEKEKAQAEKERGEESKKDIF